MDLTNPVMSGHSFGGATTVLSLGLDSRFKVGIVLDGWLYPIKDEKDLSDKVNQPIMFINTESFLHEENLKKMATFSEAASDDHERICHVIKGSVHQNHIDAPFVLKVLEQILKEKSFDFQNVPKAQFFQKKIKQFENLPLQQDRTATCACSLIFCHCSRAAARIRACSLVPATTLQ
jgi:hypothetical protein